MVINFIAVISWYPLSFFLNIKKFITGELILDAAPFLGPANENCNFFGDRVELLIDDDIFYHKHEQENLDPQPAVPVVKACASNGTGAGVALVCAVEAFLPLVVGVIDAFFEVRVPAPLPTRIRVSDFCTAISGFAEIFVSQVKIFFCAIERFLVF
jgi:hypothetical protein